MGSAAAKAFPTPGQPGNALGNLGYQKLQMPAFQPNLKPMPALQTVQPLKPLAPNTPQRGQAMIPTGQTPMNPWGQNRGGSGMLPLYRRPGTMPEF